MELQLFIKNNFIVRLTLSENVIMDNKDIEAQLKSLIGLNLSQNATGTLPISKGNNVLSPSLNISYFPHLQTPAEHLVPILTGEAEEEEEAGPLEAQVRLRIRSRKQERKEKRRKETRLGLVGGLGERPTPETGRC